MGRCLPVSLVLALATSGCLLNDWSEDALVEGALHYRIDKLRILGIRVSPPVLAPGVSVRLDALLVSPKGEAEAGTWSTCGLSSDEPAVIESLNCFESGQDVTELGSGGLPLSYVVPDTEVEVDCEGSDQGGGSILECAHELPLVVSSSFEQEDARAVSHVAWATRSWPAGESLPESAGTLSRSLYFAADEVVAGEPVEIHYRLRGEVRAGVFRWYVDGGTLEETGLTVAQSWTPPAGAGQKGVTVTENTWTPPADSAGEELRVFVVWDGRSWADASALATAPDMIWDELTAVIR